MKSYVLKACKIFGITILSLCLLVAGSLAVLRYIFSEDKIKEIITKEVEERMPSYKFSLNGLRYSLGGVVLSGAVLADSKSNSIVKAEDIKLTFSIFDIINKDIKLRRVGITNLKLDLIFDENNKTNIQILAEEIKAHLDKDSSMKADISVVSLANAVVNVKEGKGNFAPLNGSYNITGDINLSQKDAVKINCTLILSDDRGTLVPVLTITQHSNGGITIAGDVKLKPGSLLWVYKWSSSPTPPQPYSLLRGDAKDLKIEITPDRNVIVTGHAVATSTLLGVPYILTADGFTEVNVKKRTVRLMNVKGKVDSSSIFLENVLVGFSGELYNFSVKETNADIAHIRALLRFIPSKIFGKLKGSLAYSGAGFSGDVTIENGGFDKQADLISGLNTRLAIAGNHVKQTGIPVKLLGNTCTASIATTDNSLNRIFVDVKADQFDIGKQTGDQTSEAAKPVKNLFKSDKLFPVVITGKIDAKEVTYNKFSFTNASLSYSLAENSVTIPRLSASFLRGNISGAGNVTFTGNAPFAVMNINFDRIAVQDLAAFVPDMTSSMYGILSGRGNLNFPVTKNFTSGLKGNIAFKIDKGQIKNTGIQNGLGLLLSELKYKLKDLEFKTIDGNFTINNDNYMINSFLFDSENVRLQLQGPINSDLETTGMDISLAFTPRFIQDVPTAALALQNRRNGGWYIIPFTGLGKITEGKNIKMK